MANFMICHVAAFSGRTINMPRASDSLATRGMNRIAADFLASDSEIWINIDADIHFSAKDIDNLTSHDLPLVYGIYPKKQEDTPPCCATLNDKIPEPDANGLIELRRSGRGFMLVRRDLLESMKEENGGPALAYHNHGRTEWDFFPTMVIEGEMSTAPKGEREFISEDWAFCERARALGVKVMADTRIVLAHEGPKVYTFNADQTKKIE